MIGTSPLILLNDILPPGMPKFGLLELTPIGIALVLGGIVYLSIFGLRILSKQSEATIDDNEQEMADGIIKSYPLSRDRLRYTFQSTFSQVRCPRVWCRSINNFW